MISFVTERFTPDISRLSAQPSFIFWGRIHPQKGLHRAISLFARICSYRPDARFTLIGPDGGDLYAIQRQILELNISDNVQFRGCLEFPDICREANAASFYLQTSNSEGMAMSVVEAMQLGLVPVVTPVGEIAKYARHGQNSLIISNDDQIVDDIKESLNNDNLYRALSDGAIKTWLLAPLYKDDFLRACKEILRVDR